MCAKIRVLIILSLQAYALVIYMDILVKVLVCLLAGIGAGLGTGFAGMSAAAVIIPVLVGLLDIEPYTAVGVALASDVLASAVSAITYKKSKNTDIRNGMYLFISVIVATVVGSIVGRYIPDTFLGGASIIMALILGVKFLVKPIMVPKIAFASLKKSTFITYSILCGTAVGFICGCVGAGGGLAMLFVLTSVLGYDLKKAVGTSVFIMTFSALVGAVSHFAVGSLPDPVLLFLCVMFTLVFAMFASKIANKAAPRVLNRLVGIILLVIGIGIGIIQIFKYVI